MLAVAGVLFGIQELYALAAAALVVVGASVLWVRRARWDLRSARSVSPTRIPAGTEAVVELAVHNRTDQRSPIVGLRDRFDGGRSSIALAVAPLEPGETVRTSYRVAAPARGIFEVGPLEIELADPFGLVAVARPGAEASPLIVHPRLVDLAVPTRSAGVEIDAGDTWATSRSTGGELASVREYRTGDDLRRVHWASTARLGELMVRQDEAPVDGQLTVALDLRQEAWADGGLETALSAAGSMLLAALQQQVDTRLVTSRGPATDFGTGPAHRAAVLDLLAAAEAAPGDRQDERLVAACSAGPTLLITTAGTPGRELLAPSSARVPSALTVVLVQPDRGPPDRRCPRATGPRPHPCPRHRHHRRG